VAPDAAAVGELEQLAEDPPEEGAEPWKLIESLDRIGFFATVATADGRYFGFVIGGVLPATVAAGWLTSAWDQKSGVARNVARGRGIGRCWVGMGAGVAPAAGCMRGIFGHRRYHGEFYGFGRGAPRPAGAGWDVENDGLFGTTADIGSQERSAHLAHQSARHAGSRHLIILPKGGTNQSLYAENFPSRLSLIV
jgi:hypothetical protein